MAPFREVTTEKHKLLDRRPGKQQPELLQHYAQTPYPEELYRQDNGEEEKFLRFSFRLRRFCVFFIETFHPPFSVHNFLGTREKRMTTGTNIDL